MSFVLGEPPLEIEVVKLFAPQHACQGLTVHPALVFAQRLRRNPAVEFVCLTNALVEYRFEFAKRIVGWGGCESQADDFAATSRHLKWIVRRGFGSYSGGIHRPTV